MPQDKTEHDAGKVQREQQRELSQAERNVRKEERQAENERRKAAGQPPLPEDPETPQPV